MTRPGRAVAPLVVLVLGAAAARGQPPAPAEPAALRGDSPQTRKRLAEAEQKVLGGKAADAVEDLQRILDEAGDDLISVDGKQFRPARWVAHQVLAKLPPDVLKAYQARIEEPARKLFDAGTRDRDPRPLWQLLDRYFVSRPAQNGLLLLGDLAFERGDFRTAELLWRRLLPDANADVPYPTPPADPAPVRARLVLAVIFQGELDRARGELAAFRTKHPTAAGPFAGKTGPYADALQGFLDHPPRVAPDAPGGHEWPTFGGDPARTGRVPGPIPHYWPTRPTWARAIPLDPAARKHRPPASPPFGHPVVAAGRVYVSDGNRLVSFDLKTGDVVPVVAGTPRLTRPTDPAACSSLTAANGRLYARLGPPVVRATESPKARGKAEDESALVCFAPSKGDPTALKKVWQVAPPAAEGKAPAAWEGAPLVADRRMWAALARVEGGRVVRAVAGFDPADPEKAPERPAWVADVSDSPLSPGAEARTRQELLTLAGRNVVFCTNDGAVVALDAATGRRAWGFAYPRTARHAAGANRSPDPAPAVAVGGRVFVAPADADRVYALDAETGRLLWESGPTEGAQILGVARNRLVITVTGPLRGIRGLSVVTGSHRAPDGWVQHDGTGLLGYGRGLVTDGAVVWPSRGGLFLLDPRTGRPLVPPLRTLKDGPQEWLFGNVAYADGVLVVVTPTEVRGYIADGPARPPQPDPEPRPRFEALVDRAELELANGNEPAARDALAEAVRGDFPPSWRAWAAARLLLLAPRTDAAGKLPPGARAALQPKLLGEWLLTADGEFVSLGTLLDRHTGREPAAGGSPVPSTLPADRRPEDAPGLDPDAAATNFVKLPPGAYPLRPIAGAPAPPRHAFAAPPRELVAVALDTGKKASHVAADLFTHAADLDDGFVAAGPFAVAVYGTAREPAWVFRVPETDPLPAHPGDRPFRTGERPPHPQLSAFTLAGAWLLLRAGEHHLLALDLKARRVAWVLGAHGRPRYEPRLFPAAPRFEPHVLVTGRLVVAQLADGRRWLIQADTGRVWDGTGATFAGAVPHGYGEPTARVPWPHPPVEVAANRVALSDGPGRVRLVNLASGREKWVYEADGESSLAGDPPQVRAWGDALLVAVRRNYGVEIDRVEPTDGKSAWTGGPVFFDASRVDLAAADADPLRLYVSAGGKLFAHRLDDGKLAWEAELPAGGAWVVRAGRRAVIAYPAEAVPDESPAAVWGRVRASFRRAPLGWRLPWLAATAYDSWTARTVPVLLFDPETGKQLKALSIPARGPGVAAWFDGDLAAVATGDRVAWLR